MIQKLKELKAWWNGRAPDPDAGKGKIVAAVAVMTAHGKIGPDRDRAKLIEQEMLKVADQGTKAGWTDQMIRERMILARDEYIFRNPS